MIILSSSQEPMQQLITCVVVLQEIASENLDPQFTMSI